MTIAKKINVTLPSDLATLLEASVANSAINLPVEQVLAKFSKIYADNSKFRQCLPRNARDIKTAEQQAFLKEHQGRPNFTEKAFCLYGADFASCVILPGPEIGEDNGLF